MHLTPFDVNSPIIGIVCKVFRLLDTDQGIERCTYHIGFNCSVYILNYVQFTETCCGAQQVPGTQGIIQCINVVIIHVI